MRRPTQPIRPTEISVSGAKTAELADLLASLSPAAEIFATKSDLRYDIRIVATETMTLVSGSYDGDLSFRTRQPTDTTVIFFPVDGRAIVDADRKRILSEKNQGVILEEVLPHTINIEGQRKHLGLRIPQHILRLRLTDRLGSPVAGSLGFTPELDLSRGGGLLLAQVVSLMRNGLKDGTLISAPLAYANLAETIFELMLGAIPHRYSGELTRLVAPPLPYHVKRAIDYMQANISQPITLDEIGYACGVSVRTLQQGFRDFRMTTPMAYLRNLRLEAVRQELMASDVSESVAQVALKWGFAHFGRFSANYRIRFGELPSETLRAGKKIF